MRKTLFVLAAAAATGLAVAPAAAQTARGYDYPQHPRGAWVAPAAGVVAGTVVGVGLANSWFASGGTFWSTTWPTTAAGAAATGLVAGIGTAAVIHMVTTPCQGLHAALGGLATTSEGCVNGQWVGYNREPRRVRARF